jgi:hypothetical protein
MHLRAPNVRPSVAWQYCPVTHEFGGAMTYSGCRTLLASLSGLALMLAASATFAAGSGAALGGASAAHPAFRPSNGRSFQHHRNHHVGAFWPGAAGWVYDGSTPGEPGVDIAPPTSGDVHYTYTQDVPWDAVHRFPPNVMPSARPYVPDCTAQTVTVPRREGAGSTANVNIMRCY